VTRAGKDPCYDRVASSYFVDVDFLVPGSYGEVVVGRREHEVGNTVFRLWGGVDLDILAGVAGRGAGGCGLRVAKETGHCVDVWLMVGCR
jgi:hypothetical protein